MPVKKGRDFNEMLTPRQLEYESKAYRLNTVYAVGLRKKEN
jgi:DNA-3-methyladenine glycosylase II